MALLLLAAAGPLAGAPLAGVGARDGRRVIDGTALPWAAVARLQVPGESRCTAVLVGPRTALTAAHCLWSRRVAAFVSPGMVHVLSRYASGGFAHHSVARAFQVAPGFDPAHPERDRSADVAVVTLAEGVGHDALALLASPPGAGAPAMLGGYNQDRGEVIEADETCHIVATLPRLLRHDCAGTHGTSGGPLLVRGADGAWQLAGLQVAGDAGRSGGIAVAAAVLQDRLDRSDATP